ncbi:hypothetical protein SCHPADRAFT_961771 [Schizopora paradoxa]|uniref:Carbohydrate esterase family 16 protein n=1 Tax=Schizopora paradoxa TaxID=27342 RepID=A0A0H2RWK2_9AGAM|nr:hypothetical protein SCHPADRAFT_961771 [Schizopora paradoxa]
MRLLTCTVSLLVVAKIPFSWRNIDSVFAFGDSYTFVQGTEGHTNFSFIGDAMNFSFTTKELFNDRIIPKFTSSGGSNWIEFLTGCLAGHPLECSVKLWDFAFAGADIDGSLLPLHHPFTVPLVDQVKQFANFAASSIPHTASKTMTAWWIGINDTGDSADNATITDFHAFWETEMTSLFNAVELAHSSGLTGTHLFLAVPPEERNPSSLQSASAPVLKQHIIDFNSVLLEHAGLFAKKHANDGTSVLLFDTHDWFNWALENASDLGFTNTTGFCECTDEPGFFWFDSGHPTEPVHKLLASALVDFLEKI